jgi:hypothetical protein
MPERMRKLEVDKRGYPVPWFVQWVNGEPDFRIVNPNRFRQAIRFGNCWICGDRLGARRTFVMGTLNIVNRVTSEPACHVDCAKFAAMACPFLVLPNAKYREAVMPPGAKPPAGLMTNRNPGVVALWTTKSFKIQPDAQGHRLIVVSSPVAVEWYAHGRYATRAEVRASLDDGMPLLYGPLAAQTLKIQRMDDLVELENSYHRALQYLPKQSGGMFTDGF